MFIYFDKSNLKHSFTSFSDAKESAKGEYMLFLECPDTGAIIPMFNNNRSVVVVRAARHMYQIVHNGCEYIISLIEVGTFGTAFRVWEFTPTDFKPINMEDIPRTVLEYVGTLIIELQKLPPQVNSHEKVTH